MACRRKRLRRTTGIGRPALLVMSWPAYALIAVSPVGLWNMRSATNFARSALLPVSPSLSQILADGNHTAGWRHPATHASQPGRAAAPSQVRLQAPVAGFCQARGRLYADIPAAMCWRLVARPG